MQEDTKTHNTDVTILPKMGGSGVSAVLPAVWKRYTREEFKDIIESSYGIVTLACAKLDCTYSQYYTALKKWNLQEFNNEVKKQLVGKAEKVLFENLDSESEITRQKAAEVVLKSQMAQDMGWGQNSVQIAQQINVVDKETAIKNIFGIADTSVGK